MTNILKPHSNPEGYNDLLIYKKSEELQLECRRLTANFGKLKTMIDLADQMDRSARSDKQNIVEGWKRNTTNEYHQFLGFSVAAIAELQEDCKDVWGGVHRELEEKELIMGAERQREIKLDSLKFYPLDKSLPPIIQLFLRCKELVFLVEKTQKSLEKKMSDEGTMKRSDKIQRRINQEKSYDKLVDQFIKDGDMVKLLDGRIMKREEWEKGGKREKLWGEK